MQVLLEALHCQVALVSQLLQPNLATLVEGFGVPVSTLELPPDSVCELQSRLVFLLVGVSPLLLAELAQLGQLQNVVHLQTIADYVLFLYSNDDRQQFGFFFGCTESDTAS